MRLQCRVGEAGALPGRVVRVVRRERRQPRCGAAYGGGVQLAQFAGDDPHRPAVGDDVVEGEHQRGAARGGAGGVADQQDADQRAGAQVERPDRLGAQGGVGLLGGAGLRHAHRDLQVGLDRLRAPAVHRGEGGAQRLVPGDQARDRRAQRRQVEGAGQPERRHHVVLAGAGRELVEEPQAFLREGERQRTVAGCPGHRAAGGGAVPRRGRVDGRREGGDGRVVEERARGQLRPQPRPQPRDHLQPRDGVPAQREEVLVRADPLGPEHLRPDLRHHGLRPGQRRGVLRALLVPAAVRVAGRGQRPPVDLAVDGQRQRRQLDQVRGDHVRGQPPGQVGPDRRHVQRHTSRRDHVRHQPLRPGAALPGRHRDPADVGAGPQRRLDLAQFDAVAADLHLAVAAAEEGEAAVGAAPHHVPRAVEPPARAEGVGHEPGRGQRGLPVVATGQPRTAQVQLTRDTDADRAQRAVQHVGQRLVHRAAEGDGAGAGGVVGGDGAAEGEGGGLGRAVDVDEFRAGAVRGHPRHRGGGGGLAAGPHLAQPREAGRVLLGERAEERRGQEDRRHPAPGRAPHHRRRQVLLGHLHAAAVQQRHPHLVGGGVEGVRRVEQHVPVGARLPPPVGREGDHGPVGDGDALRRAGRPGGGHDVRRFVGRDGPRRGARARLGGVRHPPGGVREAQHADPGRQVGGGGVGQQELGPGAAEDLLHPLHRVGRVQRDVGRARLQHRQHRHHHVRRAAQQQPHPGPGSGPAPAQRRRDPVRAGVQLAVGVGEGAAADGGRVRCRGHPQGERPGHRGVLGHRAQAAAPLAQHPGALDSGQQRQRRQVPLAGLLGEGGEGPQEALGEPLGGVGVEERRVVTDGQLVAAGGADGQGQRVVGGLDRVQLADRHPVTGRLARGHRVVLDHQQAVEERGRTGQAGGDLVQRYMGVLVGPRLRRADPPQPRPDRLAGQGGDPHGHGVDEEAHRRLG
ncbi:hypothetical protein GA0115236_13314, partial [Streptomyces sp. IgraMP-1]